ncbi:hypothetical protein PENOC_112480 [Penicillium occitanis (nom. inval.)]|nr:hypothetical protein PENOC_112480 [Penicillium occitanis (nom. inval.)]
MDHLLDIEQEPGCAALGLQDVAQIAYALGFSSDSIRRYVCEAGFAPVGTGSGRPPSSRLLQIRSPSLPRHLRNLRASRDRLTFDQIYLQRAAGKTDQTLAEFEIFRDALRSFFPNLPPKNGPSGGHGESKSPSAPFEPTGLDVSAFIEELNNRTLEDNFPASGEVYHLSRPVSWSTDSGSFYSRATSGEPRSLTQTPDSPFSAGQRHSQFLLPTAQRASGTWPNPDHGLLAVECTQAPPVLQRAMYRANGVWIYHDTSPPMLYKLPPARARRIFIHTIVRREPDHWYAILDANGAFERIPGGRAIELLGVKLIIYGQSRRVDPSPNVHEVLDFAPRQVQSPARFPASPQATKYPWNWI